MRVRRSPTRLRGGVTLLEIAVTLVVTAILAAIGEAAFANVVSAEHVSAAQTTALNVTTAAIDRTSSGLSYPHYADFVEAAALTPGVSVTGYQDAGGVTEITYDVSISNVTNNVCVNLIDAQDSTPTLCGTTTGSSTPSSPQSLTVTGSTATSVSLSWTAPAFTGGAPVTGYVVQYSSDGGTTWVTATAQDSATTYTVNGLSGGVSYIFQVAASNTTGIGTYSSTVTTTTPSTTTVAPTPPSAPSPVVTQNVFAGPDTTAAWDWLASSGGSGTITYFWSLAPAVTGCSSGSTTNLTVSCVNDLTPGSVYTISVYAQDGTGLNSTTGTNSILAASQPQSTTTTQPPITNVWSPLPYPLSVLATSSPTCSSGNALAMSGAALVISGQGLAPIGVNSTCASSITLSGTAQLDASAIQTSNPSLDSYCFFLHKTGPGCSTTNTGPPEYYQAPATDPFTSLAPPPYPTSSSNVSCSPSGDPITCPAGNYATSPTLTNTAKAGVTFGTGSGSFIFDQPVSISNLANVTFGSGTYWFKSGLIIGGNSTVNFGTGTYIFGNPASNTCTNQTCFSSGNGATINTSTSGVLLYNANGAMNIENNAAVSIQPLAAYDGIALWDAAAHGTTYPLTISNSGNTAMQFGGIYVPNGQIILTGSGTVSATFAEVGSANVSNTGTLTIGS